MEQSRNYPWVKLTRKGEKFIRDGHIWVYDAEVVETSGEIQDGVIADVITDKGKYLGSGFYNSHSKIRVRILSRNANDRFDRAFWERRIQYALDYRQTVMGNDFGCCRLIFGEADGFPGLTVDRFEDVLVTEIMCLGIEQRKDEIFALLVQAMEKRGEHIRILYQRNEAALREREGLTCGKGYYTSPEFGLDLNSDGHVMIHENGVTYDVDFIDGQKTGFFLDQKYNRQAVARLARGKTVLDCFTHTGAFALNAALGGAKKVTAVDISEHALACARHNAELSGLCDNTEFVCSDVFDLLTRLENQHDKTYDFIILDPPAFTKSNQTKERAYRGYKDINLRAMKILPRGGYLATCSCSHFMTNELFCKMLHDAAQDAGVSLRQIEGRQQGPDHPILWNVPETDYLKFYLFQIV